VFALGDYYVVGLDHKPGESGDLDSLLTSARNSRYGLVLFAIYLAVYTGYVWLSAFRPDLAEATPVAGVNVAVLYGFGLIVAAFVLALLYGWLCRKPVHVDGPGQEDAA
jgi:uncharacterized membrane protein (DUF485 family)